MSAHKTCDSCQWWDQDTKVSGYAPYEGWRYCRATTPVVINKQSGPVGTWPMTRPDDWCAHHKEAA